MIVTGLWDSFADDAFVRDVESGIFFDPAKMHVLGHKGEELSVRGPLNIARPVQGWPVIVQAGASEAGRQIAAETAEAVFGASGNHRGCACLLCRREGPHGPARPQPRPCMKILPGCFVVVGETEEAAKAKRAKLDSLVHYANAIASLSMALGVDASSIRPGWAAAGRFRTPRRARSGRERAIRLAQRENLTVRQLAQRLGGYAGLAMVGTPTMIADQMQHWLETDACDGFNVMFPFPASGAWRSSSITWYRNCSAAASYRREYEGATLRENLGLPRPANRFFAG